MPRRHDSINSMSTADKLLRVGTFGGFALLLLLVTVSSFSDGPGPQDAPQVAEASQEAPATEMTDAAPQEEAPEEPVDIAEAPEAEDVPEVEVAETEVETADAAPEAETTEAAPEGESAEPEATAEAVEETEMAAEADADAPEPEAVESGTVAEAEVAQADAASEADAPAEDTTAESTLLASADIESGESAFRQCSACHQYENERNGAGPHLVGIVGRDIGAVDDWRYSDALLDAEGVWTPERLNAWLTNPDDYLPGNRMAYPGVRSEQERIDIIGFLAAQAQD